MNIRPIRRTLLALTFVAGAHAAAVYAEPNVAPRVDTHGTTYVSGGIGEGEAQRMQQLASDYNVKFILSEKSGAYAAAVKLAVVDASGQHVLDVPDAGPIVLANLPRGQYQIVASYEGKPVTERVAVKGNAPQTIQLIW